MANKSTVIRISHAKQQTNPWDINQESGDPRTQAARLADLFERIACGLESCTFTTARGSSDLAKASATVTCASVVVGNTVTIGKTTLTAIANGGTPTAAQFAVGSGGTADADTAKAIAAAINANTTLNKIVTATAAAAVVTVTALHAGVLGNHIVLSSSGATLTCTGSGYLAGGTGDDVASTSYSRV